MEPEEWAEAPASRVVCFPGALLPPAPFVFQVHAAALFLLLLVPGPSEAAVDILVEALFIVSLQVLPLLC